MLRRQIEVHMLLLSLVATAGAGVVAGAFATVDVPLALPTEHHGGAASHASPTGVGGLLLAGWRQELGPVRLQPELLGRLDPVNRLSLFGAGAVVTVGTPLSVGAYAHAGLPSYFGPAWDVGGVLELRASDLVRPGLRAGYSHASIPHGKCGACLQASDHFATVAAGVTFAL